jgi:glycosyltransferase involved in cell wall biosynthesis
MAKGPSEVNFIAPVSSLQRRVRLAKLAKMLLRTGYNIQHLGWERVPGEMAEGGWSDSRVRAKPLLKGGGYAQRRARLMYPLWMVAVFLRLLFARRGSVWFALGWETAFPALIASYVSGARVVFDDADRFSMLFEIPGPVGRLVRSLESWTSRNCVLHIVPCFSRYEWRHDGMFELRNVAMEEDYSAARAQPRARPRETCVIYMNGWIARDTGADFLQAAVLRLRERGLECRVLLAGKIASETGAELAELAGVQFVGDIEQRDALQWYAATDVVVTLYDPAVPINTYACSNKWGDCIHLGTPFIVNTEVVEALRFIASGAALGVRYGDIEALANAIERLSLDHDLRDRARVALARHRGDLPPFEEQFGALAKRLGLVVGSHLDSADRPGSGSPAPRS